MPCSVADDRITRLCFRLKTVHCTAIRGRYARPGSGIHRITGQMSHERLRISRGRSVHTGNSAWPPGGMWIVVEHASTQLDSTATSHRVHTVQV